MTIIIWVKTILGFSHVILGFAKITKFPQKSFTQMSVASVFADFDTIFADFDSFFAYFESFLPAYSYLCPQKTYSLWI